MNRLTKLLLALLLAAGSGRADDPLLWLKVENGPIGGTFQAQVALQAQAQTSLGGVNGTLILPQGIHLVEARLGEAAPDHYFGLSQTDERLRFLVYGPQGALAASGTLVTLTFNAEAGLSPGLRRLDFAADNPSAELNERHALSNGDGSLSLAHQVQGAAFLLYDATSDYDGDGMSDAYESAFGLDPFQDDADQDSDGDGYTNLQEFQRDSDPLDAADYNDCLADILVIPARTFSDSRAYICRVTEQLVLGEVGGEVAVTAQGTLILGAPQVKIPLGARLRVERGGRLVVE